VSAADAAAVGGRSPRWFRHGATRGAVFGWLAVLVAATSGAAALGDNSFLTHLTTGRRMLGGHLPSTDPYSFTAHGQPWVIQSWLASWFYAVTEKLGHGLGVRLMVAVLSAVIAAVLWRLTRPGRSVVTRLASVAPAILIGTVAWGARPLIFGLVGFVLVLLVLTEERDPRWLVPVMWVWVNTHGSFPLGLALVVGYGFGVWCDRGALDHVIRTAKWCVFGTLLGALNPLGPKLLWFPIELLTKQDVLSNMIEWQAPAFTDTWQRIFLVTFVVAMALVPRLPAGRRYRLLLPALLFTALGLTATRNIALASFALTPLLATELAGLGSLTSRARARLHTVACAMLAATTVVLVGARLSGPSFDLSSYPTAAVDWLGAHGRLTGDHRIASRDTVGNFLEFRTEGRTRVFVDDRVDMFPAQVIDDEKTLLAGRPGWQKVLNRWDVDTVLWENDEALTSLLAGSPNWKLTKRFHEADATTSWVIFERADRSGR
jgi:hypothetical protein